MEPTILVVDDHLETCILIQRVLTHQGYAVSAVADGEAALAAVAAQRPSLVIVDVLLPGLDGVTLLTLLRRHDPGLPLIAISAADAIPRLAGIPFLAKPFGLTTLLQLVAGTLAGSLPASAAGTPPSYVISDGARRHATDGQRGAGTSREGGRAGDLVRRMAPEVGTGPLLV